MKRKVILAIMLTLPLLFLTIFAANNSIFALSPNNDTSQSNNVIFTGACGDALVQLPSNSSPPAPPGGTANHPTILWFSAAHFDKGSTEGAFDSFAVFVWQPVLNKLTAVALITDSANYASNVKIVWNGTYMWYPALFPNVIQVEPQDLEVWTGSNGNDASSSSIDTLNVNLTKAVTVTLPYFNATGVNSNQTFTLPPLSLMFKAISNEFNDPTTIEFKGWPLASNYTWVRLGSSQFAAVRITIPTWFGGNLFLEATGHVHMHFSETVTPPATPAFGNTNIGTYQDGNDANAKSASYFKCSYTGMVTDIFAYFASAGDAGDGAAAIYADNGGSPGALVAATDKVTVGTAFSWVDFHFASPVSVTSGTGYWLAISSNNALNLNIVAGSGTRVHNSVSSWFSDPFGPVWGTHDTGSMSIYAKGTTK
jgi:hypothetical protein